MKVGNKVKVREDLVTGKSYSGCFLVSDMEKYRGNVYEIERIESGDNFTLKGIDGWFFSEEMLEEVKEIKIGDIVEFTVDGKRIFGKVLRERYCFSRWLIGNNIKNGSHSDTKNWKYGWSTPDAKPVKLIVHCPTQAEFNKVNELLGLGLCGSYWENHKEETAINSEDCYSELSYYKSEEEYKDHTFISASELLGEAPELLKTMSFMGNDRITAEQLKVGFSTVYTEETIVNKLKEKTMKILKTFKNALLSKEERLLRKHNLHTDCGELTEEAWEILKLDYANKNRDVLIKAAEEAEKEE